MPKQFERVECNCVTCGKPVITLWQKGGGLVSSKDYIIVADWIWHTECYEDGHADSEGKSDYIAWGRAS